MFDAELQGEKAFLVVTQRPFEHGTEYGVVNLFSSLHPVLLEDGRPATPGDFPANNMVWWMVRPGVRGLAEPGKLLYATLEEARDAGKAGKAWYQAQVDGIEPARPARIVEIVRCAANWVSEARDIVAGNRALRLNHPPMEKVYLLWQGHLYGPLQTTATESANGQWSVTFKPDNVDRHVNRIPESALEKVPANRRHEFAIKVSLDDRPAAENPQHTCTYHLVMADDFGRWVEKQGTQMVLEGYDSLIRRYARSFLSRKRKQDFIKLLDELADQVNESSEPNDADAARIIKGLGIRLEQIDAAGDELARALLDSGILEPRLGPLLEQAERDHIERNTARLQAAIDLRVVKLRSELETLERQRNERREKLEQEIQEARREIERAQGLIRERFERECQAERERLDAQKQELDRQRDVLSNSLQQVAHQMAEGRDSLVNQFLAISPLLQQLNLLTRAAPAESAPAPVAAGAGAGADARAGGTAAESQRAPLRMPGFLHGAGATFPIGEQAFYKRFCEHVDRSGYRYRPIDLAGFHLSAKCHDLTVLGGPPGTGKSSLPRLYAEALLGEESVDGRERYLHVGVSPAWLDMRDLIGQTNLLDHCFQPAECGLYPLLVWAQEEYAARGPDSRLYLVCLDEMNLAQVEHYFSGFLQALERIQGQREIRCFAPEMVAPTDPFARWPMLRIPPSLRFVGTINFDETTRQLSQRVLDRCNLIRLPSRYRVDAESPRIVDCPGAPITQRTFSGWVNESAAMNPMHGGLLDELNESLNRLGCPMNLRRYQAIRRLLGNAPEFVCSPAEALDLQIAQRVLPQVRNLFRPGAREALRTLRRTLEGQPVAFPESLEVLREIEEREAAGDLFDRRAEE